MSEVDAMLPRGHVEAMKQSVIEATVMVGGDPGLLLIHKGPMFAKKMHYLSFFTREDWLNLQIPFREL